MILPFVGIEKMLIKKQKGSIKFGPITFHFSLDRKQWVFVFGFIQETIFESCKAKQITILNLKYKPSNFN